MIEKDLSAVERRFQKGSSQLYRRGFVITSQAESKHGVYYLHKGYIKAYAIADNGDKNLLYIIEEGWVFPLPEKETHSFDLETDIYYEAISTADVYRIDYADYVAARESDPAFSTEITDMYERMLSDFRQRLENVSQRSALRAIIMRLDFLLERFGKALNTEEILITIPYNHQDMADSISISRETVNRQISKLAKAGTVRYVGNYLVVQPRALAAIAA